MFTKSRYLDSVNDFPKIGLLYFENSGENLLRYYLENIFHIKTSNNCKKESDFPFSYKFLNKKSDNLEGSWIVASDYPCKNKEEYRPVTISCAILLVRNPIDLIMSRIFKESEYFDDALTKVDTLIKEWKNFYKYWTTSPIPVYILRYEDLLCDQYETLKQLCKFVFGLKNINNSKLEYILQQGFGSIDPYYFAYDVEIKGEEHKQLLNEENSEKLQEKFYSKLGNFLGRFNYEINEESDNFNWIADFNKENLIKSIEFHEQLMGEYLTSSYFSIKLG